MDISIKRLINNLNLLFSKLEDRYLLNCGGCCFAAYIVARELEKRYLLDFNLRIYGYYISDYSEKELYNNIIYDRDDVPCRNNTVTHYTIVYNNKFEINNSDYSNIDYIDVHGLTSEDIRCLYTYGDWNDVYSISKNIFVERFIKIVFNNYDKEIKTNQV